MSTQGPHHVPITVVRPRTVLQPVAAALALTLYGTDRAAGQAAGDLTPVTDVAEGADQRRALAMLCDGRAARIDAAMLVVCGSKAA